ncbi:MAG: hypothetical protein EOO40_00630 [Deltaproteobacteria bacterium]|nr:MAG: hypothetical protein EOO40_00630 [Deltaproteobacteria bacterium]
MVRPLIAVWLVGQLTMREALRSRLLWIGAAFALLLAGLSVAAASVAAAEQVRLIVDVGLAAQSALGSVAAVALGVGLFGVHLQTRCADAFLVRPLPRWAYLAGRAAGLGVALAALVGSMALCTAALVWVFGGSLPGAYWVQLGLSAIEVCMVLCLTLLFCTFCSPQAAAIYSSMVLLCGRLSGELAVLADRSHAPLAHRALRLAYAVLPDLSCLSLRGAAANGVAWSTELALGGACYGILYALASLFLAMFIFERRRSL